MDKAKIQRIADYLKDVEEGLSEQDYTGIIARRELDEGVWGRKKLQRPNPHKAGRQGRSEG